MSLRSKEWYDGDDRRNNYLHRAWMRRGIPEDAFERPQIAILNTASDLTPCNMHLDEIMQAVKQGIYEAGGIALDTPVMSLGETQMRPTAMLYRNLAAMSAEEQLRANPVDGAVLLGGCDKTVPSLLMAAASADMPSIVVPGGPMLTGHFKGKPLGCGTDVWRFVDEVAAGQMSEQELAQSEASMIRSKGHCNTMGTASTVAVLTEALGMSLPGSAGVPAPDSRLLQFAVESGRRIVEMVREQLRPSDIMTMGAFRNAIIAVAATGGSTNSIPHLLAIARRLGVDLQLEDFEVGADVPLLANIAPAGTYLMDDLFRAGGVLAVLKEVEDLLDTSAITVTGKPLVEYLADAEIYDEDVISRRDNPLQEGAGIVVLRGSLAPQGAVIKPAAATPELLQHRGRAVVFDSIEDLHARIEDPDLDIDKNSIIVLRGCGPKGYPGMPEAGNTPIPPKLFKKGVKDIIRVSDARMSGTAYGTVVLHVAPEAAAGGPLGLVENGDYIVLDVENRRLDLDVPEEELARRTPSQAMVDAFAKPDRGWQKLYIEHVNQADEGADLDFLVGNDKGVVTRDSH